MKALFILALAFGFLSTATAQKAHAAVHILQAAMAKARAEKKNVFVKFTASWCVWCRKMDASMEDVQCKKFFDDNFVIVHLVVDESENKKHLENPGADSI